MATPRRILKRLARLLGRPARGAVEAHGVVLQPFRGYGSRDEIFLIGRVFREPGAGAGPPTESAGRDALDLGRRFFRRGIGGAALIARFGGTEQRLSTDRDGYFRVSLRPADPPPRDRLWHEVEIEMLRPETIQVQGDLFVPPDACRYVVISDIDDTIMHTGVASKAAMLWRLFMEGAESRVAFPGMAALLQAFHAGVTGVEYNPMLYVSRAPWSNYEVLDAFFQIHAIPVGPLLFLREWGLTWQRPLPRRGKGHKLAMIRHMLEIYRDLPVVLVGDSGQRDPEIYAQVVHENPGRVRAVYLRNVSSTGERVRAIEALAVEVARAGSTLLLAADSLGMAEHAVRHGLIGPDALAIVRDEAIRAGETRHAPTREVVAANASDTAAAVEHGRLVEVLGAEDGPPNVVVEAKDDATRAVNPARGKPSAPR